MGDPGYLHLLAPIVGLGRGSELTQTWRTWRTWKATFLLKTTGKPGKLHFFWGGEGGPLLNLENGKNDKFPP